jgi:hypothetical protein
MSPVHSVLHDPFITGPKLLGAGSGAALGVSRATRNALTTVDGVHTVASPNRTTSGSLAIVGDDDFEVDGLAAPAQAVFDSVRAKLMFQSDVFWARSSIGSELLDLWLDTYQTSRSFRKRGIVELERP